MKYFIRFVIGNVRVWVAGRLSYKYRVDMHGRTYKDAYKKFGHTVMVDDYLCENSWRI